MNHWIHIVGTLFFSLTLIKIILVRNLSRATQNSSMFFSLMWQFYFKIIVLIRSFSCNLFECDEQILAFIYVDLGTRYARKERKRKRIALLISKSNIPIEMLRKYLTMVLSTVSASAFQLLLLLLLCVQHLNENIDTLTLTTTNALMLPREGERKWH